MSQSAHFKETPHSVEFTWEKFKQHIPLCMLQLFTIESKAGNSERGQCGEELGQRQMDQLSKQQCLGSTVNCDYSEYVVGEGWVERAMRTPGVTWVVVT